MLKVVLLYDKLNVGGTEKLFVLIANLLFEYKHKVTVVIIDQPNQLDHLISKGIEIVYLNRKKRFSLKAFRLLSNSCKSADVIHVHAYFNWRYLFLAKKLFGLGNTKVVLHEHSNMNQHKWFDRFLIKGLDGIIAVSEKQIEIIKKWKTILPHKIFLVPNVIVVNNKIGNRPKVEHRIIMVGNIRREKNYELALSIIAHFKGRLTLSIYGKKNDPAYYDELVELMGNKNITGLVNIISDQADVSKFYASYDLALHTASMETGPLVLMEYLSAGLPFFCSTAGQSSTIISREFPELVVSSYGEKVWIDKVERFYQQTQEARNQLTESLKTKAREILNTGDYYKSLLQVYNKIVA